MLTMFDTGHWRYFASNNEDRASKPFLSLRTILTVALIAAVTACAPRREGSPGSDSQMQVVNQAITEPLSPEETSELLGEVSNNWLFGEGIGDTAITVGTVVIFPPFALWVAGNAVASLAGYEPIRVSDILPEKEGREWAETYSNVASGPGRVAAAVAGKEFRTKEQAREKLRPYIERDGKSNLETQK